MKKPVKYDANIQVNIRFFDENGSQKRSSTTLSYTICNYFFAEVLFLKEKKPKQPSAYRKWLVEKVQNWTNEQELTKANSQILESLMLKELYEIAYKKGRDDSKENLSLDL